MKYKIEYCPFDSKIFARKWGRIIFGNEKINESDLKDLINEVQREGFEYLDTKILTTERELLHLLIKYDFRLICTQVKLTIDNLKTFSLNLNENHHSRIHLFQPEEDINGVLDTTAIVFSFDRFSQDTYLPTSKVSELYREWAKNNFLERADFTLTNGKSVCFNRIKNGIGIIDLIAVSIEEQGKGIGTELVMETIRQYKNISLERAEVVTELENIPSIHLYEKCGYRIRDSWYVFHRKGL